MQGKTWAKLFAVLIRMEGNKMPMNRKHIHKKLCISSTFTKGVYALAFKGENPSLNIIIITMLHKMFSLILWKIADREHIKNYWVRPVMDYLCRQSNLASYKMFIWKILIQGDVKFFNDNRFLRRNSISLQLWTKLH